MPLNTQGYLNAAHYGLSFDALFNASEEGIN
jgi:hypothetical protein